MAFLHPVGRFRLLCLACLRLHTVLIRTVLALVPHSDREILLSWPFVKRLGWDRTEYKTEWERCLVKNGRVVFLNLDALQLTSLPESIGRLTALTELWCGHNQLTSLPDSIGKLVALRQLWCHNNRLTNIPEPIRKLALHVLYSHNQRTV